MIRFVTRFLRTWKTGSCMGRRKIPYSAVVQLIEPSIIRASENTSRILNRDGGKYWVYDHRVATTSSERMGCSCGHQTCMDFLVVRAPNFRLPHHTERVRNRMCHKCLHYTKKLDLKKIFEARLFGRDSHHFILS
jgi:hypothetical protein